YLWFVTAVSGPRNGRSCGGLLRLLTPEESAAVERQEKAAAAARAAAPDDPAPLLLLAQTYERWGLADAARAAYQDALRLRPGDPGVQAAVKSLPGGGSP